MFGYINKIDMALPDNEMIEHADNICTICDNNLDDQGGVQLRSCGQSFHFVCFMKCNAFRGRIKYHSGKNKENEFVTQINFPGRPAFDIIVAEARTLYSIRYDYYLANMVDGYAILMGFYRSFEKSICERRLLKFKIAGTSHSFYIHYPHWTNPTIITKTEKKSLPLMTRVSQIEYSCELDVGSKEILKLEVKPVAVDENMKVVVVKVLLVNGITSEEMGDLCDLTEIANFLHCKKRHFI